MNSSERRIVFYTATAHALVHTTEFTYAALLGRIGHEFGTGPALLGAIANVWAFAFGASALPSGLLTDRLGSRNVLYYAFLAAAVAAVLVGLAPTTLVMAGALTLLGLTIGLYHPPAVSLIAQGVRQRGLAIGYHGVTGNLGIAVTPILVGGIADLSSWRGAYFFLAAAAVAMALFVRAVGVSASTKPAATTSADPAEANQPQSASPTILLPLVMIYAAFVLNGFIYRGSLTFLPLHIEEEGNRRLAESLTTAALLTGAVGQYVGGSLCQRFKIEGLAPSLTLAVMISLFLMGQMGEAALVVAAGAFVFFNFAAQPVYNSLIAEYTPVQSMGRSYGISFFANFGIGSLGASFAGIFAERWGTPSVFLGLSGFAAVTLLLSATLWVMARQRAWPSHERTKSQV